MNAPHSRAPFDSAGTIATPHSQPRRSVTPAEGFAFDAAALDRATRALIKQAEEEGWSVDLSALAGL